MGVGCASDVCGRPAPQHALCVCVCVCVTYTEERTQTHKNEYDSRQHMIHSIHAHTAAARQTIAQIDVHHIHLHLTLCSAHTSFRKFPYCKSKKSTKPVEQIFVHSLIFLCLTYLQVQLHRHKPIKTFCLATFPEIRSAFGTCIFKGAGTLNNRSCV